MKRKRYLLRMISYDPHQWWAHFFDIKGSMLREILGRVALCVVWASLVVIFEPRFLGDDFTFPLSIHSILGTALGLLLVFRTNSAYDRFWEGRKLWGAMVNESRNLVRSTTALTKRHPEYAKAVVDWTTCLVYTCLHSLRDKKSLGEARRLLSEPLAKKIEGSDHPSLSCALEITSLLHKARSEKLITDYDFVYLDQNVQLIVDYVGGCERIHRTPLPFAYLVHLRRALVVYCFALPFALIKDYGWFTIPATLSVAYIFFGIEEIGVEIEDPFGEDYNDLPLEQISQMIHRNISQLAQECDNN